LSNPKRLFICFTGIDGSGKTTHGKYLIDFLSKKGYKFIYVWAAFKPLFSYIFFGVTRLLGYWKKTKKDTFIDPLEMSHRRVHDRLSIVFRVFLFIDFHIRTLIKIRLPMLLGMNVVSDRYVYDMIVDLILLRLYSRRFGRLILYSLPKPHLIFLTDAPEHVVFIRRKYKSILSIRIKRKVYLKIAEQLNFFVLDTSNSFVDNQMKIRQIVTEKIIN
jgi:dTMP kinase